MLLDTPICDFGWKAPDFTLNDPAGRSHALRDHLGDGGLLIMFICNHCPYFKAIATRLADDTRTLIDDGIGVPAVMSNDWHDVPVDLSAGTSAGMQRRPELLNAMRQIAETGQGPRAQVPSIGCSIKWH